MNVNFGRPGFAGRAAAALPRVCVSAVSGLYPCRLRACGAARSLPCADHAAHQLLRAEGLREAVQHRTAARSDGGAWPAQARGAAKAADSLEWKGVGQNHKAWLWFAGNACKYLMIFCEMPLTLSITYRNMAIIA